MPKTYKITAEEVEIEKIGVHENTVSEWVCSFKKIGCCWLVIKQKDVEKMFVYSNVSVVC